MDCHRLIYKPLSSSNPYEKYIVKQKEKQITQKKELFYSEIFKFTSSRYPKQFLLELEKEINPFQHSLQTLRNIILVKYPDLPDDVVNESVEYVFGKKAREATMIKQSETIIEDGDQYIRNGRKLIKEDFSFNYRKHDIDSGLPSETSRNELSPESKSGRGSNTKRSAQSTIKKADTLQALRKQSQSPLQTERGLLSSARKNGISISKNQLFNEMIAEQIQKQSNRYKSIDIIHEGDPDDLVIKQEMFKKLGFTDRSGRSGFNDGSFPNFRNQDVIVPVEDGMETGRTDMEELQQFLTEVSMICQEKEGLTSLSERGMYMMKISRKNMQNLYKMQGTIKMDAVKRAVNRMLAEYD